MLFTIAPKKCHALLTCDQTIQQARVQLQSFPDHSAKLFDNNL